jgi:hypothetical protein
MIAGDWYGPAAVILHKNSVSRLFSSKEHRFRILGGRMTDSTDKFTGMASYTFFNMND